MTQPGDLRQIISRFGQYRIGVLGDIMLDRFIYGDVHRISPEAPVPVVAVKRRTVQAGGAGNVACNIRSLGGTAVLFGLLGEDEAGEETQAILKAAGVALDGVVSAASCCTTVKTRIVARSQHMLRIDEERHDSADPDLPKQLLAAVERGLAGLDVLVVSDYAKGVFNHNTAPVVLELCSRAGIQVLIDPKPANVALYRGAYLLKPNLGEAIALAGGSDRKPPAELTQRVAQAAGVENVVLTAGSDGMYVAEHSVVTHLPAHQRDVYDVAGAGDSTMAGIALGIAAGAGVLPAARLGNLAGSRAVGHLGIGAITADELLEELAGHGDA